MRLHHKIAVVTGGSQGIGEAIALKYGEEGADVAIVSIGDQTGAHLIVSQLEGMGRRAKSYVADCAQVSEIVSVVKQMSPTLAAWTFL